MELVITEHNNQKKTFCLNMIVKNESHIIIQTLKNLCNYFSFDYWVISDTGSTDNTKELIKKFFEEKFIPGELVEHQWVDFGFNRSKALEAAFNKTDYLLIFDADDQIVGDFKIPHNLTADMYMLKFGLGFEFMRPLLITNKKKWCFKGVLHEFLSTNEKNIVEDKIIGNYYIIPGTHGIRSKNPNKYYDDAIVLEKGFETEMLPTGDKSLADRYAFYCGQSFKDAGPKYIDKSIEWYSKVLELNNWTQEKYYSCCQLGNLYKSKNDMTNAVKYWLKSIEYDKERIEGLVSAVEYYYNNRLHVSVNSVYETYKNYNKYLEGKLFINQVQYKDVLEYYNSISAYYVNNKESGYEACKRILINNISSVDRINLTIKNIMFYKDILKQDKECGSFFYAIDNLLYELSKKNITIETHQVELWNILFNMVKSTLTNYNFNIGEELTNKYKNQYSDSTSNIIKPNIIITFTTCKRYDLFYQTINSIMNHCTDINKIDYWFCVDDNSSEEDRTKMLNAYPWINYYMKSFEEKGHRQSMNIIWNKLNELKPKYWIHIEDDFLFHYKTDYITCAINTLNDPIISQLNIKQVLFNRNYGEIVDNYNVKGHILINNDTNNLFSIHEYKKGNFNYSNCHYWPHYSLRPSLIEVDTILKLGNYDSQQQFYRKIN
jgi:hypothetical protein